jgi:hypothetical protein
MRSPYATRVLLAAILIATGLMGLSRSAGASEEACIAASDNELALQKAGKFLDALKELALCADPSCSSVVRAECTRRIVDLRKALPTIVLRATDAAGNDLAAVKVTLDDAPFADQLDGRATPLDPGNHKLRFEAAGKSPLEKTLVVGEAEKDRHLTVVLGDPPVRPVGVPALVAVTPPPEPIAAPPRQGPTRGGGVRTAGFVAGGGGIAGVAVGSVLGAMVLSKVSAAKGECVPTNCAMNTNPMATSDMQSASSLATASTAMFIAGGALVAGGLVMVLAGGPKREKSAVRVVPLWIVRGGGVGFSGAW